MGSLPEQNSLQCLYNQEGVQMAKKPNIVSIFLADDLGYGDFSRFNGKGAASSAAGRVVSYRR
jgi:hypothetical protein